jgi:hypothetical protein
LKREKEQKEEKLFKMLRGILSNAQANMLTFLSIWATGFAMKDVKSQVSSCCSVLNFEITAIFAFRRKYI